MRASPGIGGMMRKSWRKHSAVLPAVKVDEELGVARSPILRGVVTGIGLALHEEAFMDHPIGRFMNHNFPQADVSDIKVIFVNEPDTEVTPSVSKGSARLASSAPPQRSRTRSITPPAGASAASQSPSTSY